MFRLLVAIKNAVALSLFFMLALSGASVHAQSQTINPGGGILPDYSDGAKIAVGAQGEIQMIANNVGHLYYSGSLPPNMGYNSVTLRLAGPSGTRLYGRNSGSSVIAVSQSTVTGSGTLGDPWLLVTAFRPNTSGADNSILITVTDRFVLPNLYFTRQIAVTGMSAADTAKLYWFFDTMVGGNDAGIGYLSGTTVGTRHPTTLEKLEFRQNGSLTPWDRYFSGYYYSPASQIQSGVGDLDNSINPSTVDAGLAIQWTIPAGSTSFTGGADLIYVPAGIFARELFSPGSVLIGTNSRMTITLSSVNTSLSAATFTYTLPPGVSVAATPNVANTCSPGGGTVTASGNSIVATAVQLQAITPGSPAYTCTIALDVSGTAVGFYTPSFASSDSSVGHKVGEYGTLEVTPAVILSAAFSPAAILENGVSKLVITVSNRDAASAHNAQDFIYDSYNTNLVTTAATPVVTSTCPGTPAVAVSGTQLTFSQIDLPIAPSSSTPYQCQITVEMTSPLEGYYYANFVSSTTGAAASTSAPSPQLYVSKAVQADAHFNPAQTIPGAITHFEMTVANSSLSPSSSVNFSYPFNSTDIQPAATPNLTNTCSPGGTVTLSSTGVDVTSLVLNAATTAPYRCTIAFDVQVSASPSSSYYYAMFNTPDQSVSALAGSTNLFVFTTPPGGALWSSVLEKSVIAPNEPNSITLTFSSLEPAPLSGLNLGYQFALPVTPLGTPVSTCPAGANFTLTASGFSVSDLSLPAAGATPYSCTATFRFTASVPTVYDTWVNNFSGPWNPNPDGQRFLVQGGFLPPPQPVTTAIPALADSTLLLLMLSLLAVGGYAYRRSTHR